MKSFFKNIAAYVVARPRLDLLFLSLGVVVFVAVTVLNATNASIWFDEAFSVYIAQFNFAEIAQFTAADVHPPLYYWLLKVWEMLFGSSELAVRSLSILFGAVTIVITFFLSRKLFGRLAAGLTVGLLALSPMLIRYSDEARMYTLAAAIVMGATYVLVKATETNRRTWWIMYGVLVGLGMWTHYFTALAWLAHWAWRFATVRKQPGKASLLKKFFTRQWILSHLLAITLFLPWLPFMAIQLGGIQGGGFWIGPVGLDTIPNYVANLFYYLQHDQVMGWWSLLLAIAAIGFIILGVRTFRSFDRTRRRWYLLTIALAVVPVMVLFLASLPPLKSSFVERYLLPAVVGFALFGGVTLAARLRTWRPWAVVVSVVVVVGMMGYGIVNVYRQGNYNKNSDTHILTRELVQKLSSESEPGTPIVANSPWIFYEAVFYDSTEHPVYFIDENTDYIYGSLVMLRDRDGHKIKDLQAFERAHPTFWYIGVSSQDLEPAEDDWRLIRHESVSSPLNGQTLYRAALFTTTPE